MFKDFLNASLENINLKSQAKYVEVGYGQVEPNHLSAQRTGQIYAQLPANPEINILENGQFVKYDYAANDNGIGEVNFTGEGEWMLVYNEIKLYRNHFDGTKQWDCEFAMIKDNYQARIYSPYDYENAEEEYHSGLYLNGKDHLGNTSMEMERYFTAEHPVRDEATGATVFKSIVINETRCQIADNKFTYEGTEYEIDPISGQTKTPIKVVYEYDDVTADVPDIYEFGWTNDPYKRLGIYREKRMPKGTSMVPRVFKTNVGDLFTTNMINEQTLAVNEKLYVGANGILTKTKLTTALTAANLTDAQKEAGILPTAVSGDMVWQVVKLYTMPDGQKGVKLMRIA